VSPRQIAGQLGGGVLSRMLRGWAHTSRLLRAAENDRGRPALPRRRRRSSISGLAHQVTAFADEGASSSQIAQRTGLAHDAIALILHFRSSPRAELSTDRGTICRTDPEPRVWVADA
jgi:hypothetical protein